MVKKVIPSAWTTEPVRKPTQGGSVPSHGNVTLGNTEQVGRPFRERRVPSYFNDFLLSLDVSKKLCLTKFHCEPNLVFYYCRRFLLCIHAFIGKGDIVYTHCVPRV